MRFADRAVIVTGAGSGFGLAIARRFAEEGARVACADIESAAARASAEELGADRTIALECDVASGADFERAVAATLDAFGRLDVVVNNAGIPHRSMPLVELPEADFDRVFAVNVKSVYHSAVHAVPALRAAGGGSIVNVASIGAKRPRPNLTAYNASKGAVVTMTRGMAAELARDGIRVNAVDPLAAETGFVANALGIESYTAEMRERLEREVPLRRLCEPWDVAAAVAFLASEDARFLTGVCLDVDGGKSI